MLDETLTLAVGLVDRYGIAALFVAFALEGALVGKVLPTRLLFLGVAVAAGPAPVDLLPAVGAAVAGATIGQTALFVLIRRLALDPAADPRVPIDEGHLERGSRWLDRWGPAAIAISNVVPVVRGTLTVPTAMSRASGYRFPAYSLVGSVVYVGALVALAAGLEGLGTAVVR